MSNNETKTKNNEETLKVGVLALQGDFKEHLEILKKINADGIEVKRPKDLEGLNALIIPGGESTTIGRLMLRFNLFNKIIEKNKKGMAIYGTCAGAILLAKEIIGSPQPRLGLMDIFIERNAYGRQIESFEAEIDVDGIGKVNGVFIRAPIIKKIGKNVEVLAKHNGDVVVARQNNILVSAFHPELAGNTKIHEYFLSEIVKNHQSDNNVFQH